MSLNTAHINGGVLIHSGECILLFSDHVHIDWSGQQQEHFRGAKSGRIYLTTHRVIFNNKSSTDPMQSFSMPFVTLSEVEVEQPVFGANYIKGKVRAQPNGNWVGEVKFKMTFKHGGAIEFGQALLKAAYLATRGMNNMDTPPPYVPTSDWYAPPPPAYQPPPQGYYGWVPPYNVFPDQPPSNTVFMSDLPPPYPGLNPAYQPQHPGGPPQPGYNPGFNSYQPGAAGPPPPGYNPGFNNYQPGAAGGPGFQQPPFNSAGAQAKAAEAAQSAYYDPNQPQMAFVPPPAYYEKPPTYNEATKKDQ